MNALSEEQNSVVVDYAADAILPISVWGELIVHHESLTTEAMEKIVSLVGGSVHGSTINFIK